MALIDFILHIDKHLADFVNEYGTLTYGLLFLIVFVETGLVVMPLLPGDSLLFAAGALAAREDINLNVWYIIPLLIVAALMGDNVNYFIGKRFGDTVRTKERLLFLRKEHLEKTEKFFEKYGTRTVIIARFIPIVRTVAPFVSGAGHMPYRRYLTFCVIGAVLWVAGVTSVGYALGNNEWVSKHFEAVVFGIIGISLLPVIIGLLRGKRD